MLVLGRVGADGVDDDGSFVSCPFFGGKGLNHHPTDSCDFGGTRNRTLTTHAQVSGKKWLITDPLILLILQPRKKKSPHSDHRNFFGWTGCAYAVSLAVSFTQHHMLVDIQSLLLPPRKNGGAVFLHFLMTSLGQQLLRDSGLSLTTVLKSCELMFEPPFSIWETGPFAMYWETNFHPPRYRVQDDAIHSSGLEKAKFFRMKTKTKNTGVTTERFTSWTKKTVGKKTVKNSQKKMWIICNPLLWRFFFCQAKDHGWGFQVMLWHFQVSWVMGSFFPQCII